MCHLSSGIVSDCYAVSLFILLLTGSYFNGKKKTFQLMINPLLSATYFIGIHKFFEQCKESTKYYLCNITGMGKFKHIQQMAEDW
jgi:hypothetical protein